MGLVTILRGAPDETSEYRTGCKKYVLWTIYVKNGNLKKQPAIENATVSVKVGMKPSQNQDLDKDRRFTLVFDPGENLSAVAVEITDPDKNWKGQPGAAVGSDDWYTSNAPLTGEWTLTVRVLQKISSGDPVLVKEAPLVLERADKTPGEAKTGLEDGQYQEKKIPCLTDYTISLKKAFCAGAPELGKPKHTSVTLTSENKILAHVEKGDTQVTVDLIVPGWTLQIRVQDVTMLDAGHTKLKGKEFFLQDVPVDLERTSAKDTGASTDSSGKWKREGLLLGAEYKLTLTKTYGAIAKTGAAAVRVNGKAAGTATAKAPAVEQDAVKVERVEDAQVKLKAAAAGAAVEVDIQLQYPKVFIVGEGPKFPYAIALAKRYAWGEPAQGDKNRLRKWVAVSQYDVSDPPKGDYPRTLFFYKDSKVRNPDNENGKGTGCFDVREKACWTRLDEQLGKFDAIIFNNPHPGYGMHRCDVFGLQGGSRTLAGKYISVHTLGRTEKLSVGQTEERLFRDKVKWLQYPNQRDKVEWLQDPADRNRGVRPYLVKKDSTWAPRYWVEGAEEKGVQPLYMSPDKNGWWVEDYQVESKKDYWIWKALKREGKGWPYLVWYTDRWYAPSGSMEDAWQQRFFVQQDLGCVMDGSAKTYDFGKDGGATPKTITEAFQAQENDGVTFKKRWTHYSERIATTGLWESILLCYRLNGDNALRAGGYLYLHGSKNFADEGLRKTGAALDGFSKGVAWSKPDKAGINIYYAEYEPNLTSKEFHPSWLAKLYFKPGEPGLSKALCYWRPKS